MSNWPTTALPYRLVRALQVLMYGEWITYKEGVDSRTWSENGGERQGGAAVLPVHAHVGLSGSGKMRPHCFPHQASALHSVVLYFPHIFTTHISPMKPIHRYYKPDDPTAVPTMQRQQISFLEISQSQPCNRLGPPINPTVVDSKPNAVVMDGFVTPEPPMAFPFPYWPPSSPNQEVPCLAPA